MLMINLVPRLRDHKAAWYQTERNTAVLLRAILSSRPADELSGDDIWNLLQLTWITLSKGQPSPDHWKRLKIPALAALWKQPYTLRGDLKATVDAMQIPLPIKQSATLPTGMVNFRNVWRNSSAKWCQTNRNRLGDLIQQALELKPNDQSRLALAKAINKLPEVPSPKNTGRKASPAVILTPLVACLDPIERFPVINGRAGVNRLLRALHLTNRNLEDQVKGMIGLIGQFGISDSFMIDVLADDIAVLASKLTVQQALPKLGGGHGQGKSLPTFDEAARLFRVSIPTLKRMCATGDIPYFKTSCGHLCIPGNGLKSIQDKAGGSTASTPSSALQSRRERVEELSLEGQERTS